MKRYLLLLLPIVLMLGCNHPVPSKYKGYSTKNGVDYFKYSDMGTSHKHAQRGDVVETVISYTKMNDSLFWDSHDIGFPFSINLPYDTMYAQGSYQSLILQANEGDSINFIVPAEDVFKRILHLSTLPFFLHKGDLMKVNTRIVAIMDPIQFEARQKVINSYRKDMDMQEQLTLLQYVAANHITDSSKKDNIYFVPESPGTGAKVETGSRVSVAYNGYFLNGRLFDSVSVSNPLQFRFGDTAQVIKGLEIGIKRMHEGEKAKIIIPSQLAFGDNGSSTGVVPPYTSVIYEVTMLKVSDPGK
jgi:FKBP-type peptidyl-prolyl cis-trans isomerase FkpA